MEIKWNLYEFLILAKFFIMDKHQISKGTSKTVYSHINSKRFVFYKIQNKSGNHKAKFWWVKGPFGSIEKVGVLSGSGKIKIKGTLWGKLRVGEINSDTLIQIHDDPRVNTNFPTIEF